MKQLLALCLICMITTHVQAQNNTDKTTRKKTFENLTQTVLFRQQQSGNALKTTATAKRLTGVSRYEAGVLTDSTWHRYRAGKGSSHPNENSYFSNSENSVEYFKADDPRAVQYIQSDTSITYWRPGTSLAQRGKVVNDYDGSGKLTYSLHEDDGNTYEHFVTNNANGSRATVIQRDSVTGSGQPYVDKLKHYFVYDGQNRIIVDSAIYIPLSVTAYKTTYHYDGVGNLDTVAIFELISTTLEPTFKQVFTYDASKRLASATLFEENGSGWELDSRSLYSYTGAATQYTKRQGQLWDSFNAQWEDESGEIIELNSADKIVRKYSLNLATPFDTTYRADYTYNADGLFQEISNAVYLGNGNFSTADVVLHFYYEDYFPSGIIETTTNKQFTIYPNPASDKLFINSDSKAQYAIIDLLGKCAKVVQVNKGTQSIDVSVLPAGNYIIRNNRNASYQQFSITH